jgi:hypothetical protein
VEDKSKRLNRNLYFIEIKLLKILPSLIALIYFINILLNLIGVSLNSLSYIAGMSFIPLLFMYISSYVFQFCEYHRLPLHYILITNLLSIIGYEFKITIDIWLYIVLHSTLFGIAVFIALYLYLKDKSI